MTQIRQVSSPITWSSVVRKYEPTKKRRAPNQNFTIKSYDLCFALWKSVIIDFPIVYERAYKLISQNKILYWHAKI